MCPSAEFRRSCSELLPKEPIEVGEIGKAGAFRHFRHLKLGFLQKMPRLPEPSFPERLRDGQPGQAAVGAAQMGGGKLCRQGKIPGMKCLGKIPFDLPVDDFRQLGVLIPATEFFLKPAELSQQNFQMG